MNIFETRNDMIKTFDKGLKIAELGVFKGEFSKDIYELCQPSELYLVDIFEGYFGSGDKDGKNHHYVQLEDEMNNITEHFKLNENVFIKKMSTIDFLNSLEDNYLDLVYIDADHSYHSVLNDLILSHKKVKLGGYITGHDYVVNTEAERAVNHFCNMLNLEINSITKDGCPSFIIKKTH
jgi:hypothetical protein